MPKSWFGSKPITAAPPSPDLDAYRDVAEDDNLYFKKMIGVYKLRDWESEGKPSMLSSLCKLDPTTLPALEPYMPGLEYMLQAARYLPRRTISGTSAELCLLAKVIAQGGDIGIDFGQIIQNFWRNQIAQHYVKLGTNYAPVFGAKGTSANWMRFLVNRCGTVAREDFYHLVSDKFRGLEYRREFENMSSSDIKSFCGKVDQLLRYYFSHDGQLPPFGIQLTLVMPNQKRRMGELKGMSPPVPEAIQICYDGFRSSLSLSENAFSAQVASLQMNEEEIAEYCSILKSQSDNRDVAMMRLGIEIMSRQLDGRFENFQLHTGYEMPETVEEKLYAFVASSSGTFDFKGVLTFWICINPFEKVEVGTICNSPRVDPPRLSKFRDSWKRIDQVAIGYDSWNQKQKEKFCSIISPALERYKDFPKDLLESLDLSKSLELFKIELASPDIHELCKFSISRVLPDAARLAAMINGLVVQAGQREACPIIAKWNTDRKMTVYRLVTMLIRAAETRGHHPPSALEKLLALLRGGI